MKQSPYMILFISICLLINATFIDAKESISVDHDVVIERIGVKGPLEFNKTIFNLAWTDKPRDNYYIQEYLPKGETLERFDQMLTIHLFLTDLEPVDAVRQKERELIEWNKKEDQFWFYKTFHNPDSQEYMIDFLCGESKDNLMTLVEFTIYRYKQIFITVNQKALLIFGYSKRSYDEEITSFFETFEGDRLSLLNLMILSEVPDVTMTNK